MVVKEEFGKCWEPAIHHRNQLTVPDQGHDQVFHRHADTGSFQYGLHDSSESSNEIGPFGWKAQPSSLLDSYRYMPLLKRNPMRSLSIRLGGESPASPWIRIMRSF